MFFSTIYPRALKPHQLLFRLYYAPGLRENFLVAERSLPTEEGQNMPALPQVVGFRQSFIPGWRWETVRETTCLELLISEPNALPGRGRSAFPEMEALLRAACAVKTVCLPLKHTRGRGHFGLEML